MIVRELLTRKPVGFVSIEPSATTAGAAGLLIDRGVGGLAVTEPGGQLVGFVSERDIVRAVDGQKAGLHERAVVEIMRRPAPVCSAADPIRQVMSRMTRERLRHLVVMDGDRVAGVISVGDLVKHRLEQLETETGVLRDYVAAQRARG
ncbi:MAG: CBS domain-containing protein [Gemmatimonadota bacterium]